jgi:hypothetical protein
MVHLNEIDSLFGMDLDEYVKLSVRRQDMFKDLPCSNVGLKLVSSLPKDYPWRVSTKIDDKCAIQNWSNILFLNTNFDDGAFMSIQSKSHQVSY